jgi:hypothetical protein
MVINKVPMKLFATVVFLFCCSVATLAQVQPAEADAASERAAQLAKAMASLKSGKDFSPYYAEVIHEARAVEAIPGLQKQFEIKTDPLDKAKIAQVLLSLGVKNDVYWNYLEKLVTPILDSDAPDPAPDYDAQGKHIPGPSQAFVDWARSHGKSPGEAAESAVYVWPGYVVLLGASGDSRAIPLLQRAFGSPNRMMQTAAAMGLAEMQDVTSIPLIIARCKSAPSEIAAVIAESLAYFDDPEAQKAVDMYVPSGIAKALRERKKAGKGALHGR